MSNRKILYISIILTIILSAFTGMGIYRYNRKKTISNNMVIKQFGETSDENVVRTSSNNSEVVAPTARINMKQYYKKCGHTTENEFTVPEEIVNMTEKQVEKYYFGWNVESFSSTDICISREIDEICDEHYLVRDDEGFVNVYRATEENEESLVYSTEIVTKYLPKEDRDKLINGIEIVGKENLSILLEDYE
ncbi:MAG: BofC C-terminal domain-containing protein [Clostridia bacterium]|nr:BofC C-terminal domain-containing protein [Clostridia bacterium]